MGFRRRLSGGLTAGLLLSTGALFAAQALNAQSVAPSAPNVQNNTAALKALAERFAREQEANEAAVAAYLKAHPEASRTQMIDGKVHTIVRIGKNGKPEYRVHRDAGPSSKAVKPRQNVQSAALIKADSLYPGGSLGVNITGQNMIAGVWEPGLPRVDHELLLGKSTIQTGQADPTDDNSEDNVGNRNHATHVTGTMVGRDFTTDESKPADPNGTGARTARGIAHGALARNWDAEGDLAEIATAVANETPPLLLVSNHSYGDANTQTEELWKYGAYNDEARNWDLTLKAAPNYLPFIAGGNEQMSSGNSGKNGYDIMTGASAAKNTMTVGAVNADKTMSDYSNWGPTDDGRVKPEIVARGTGINSAQAFDTSSPPQPSNTAYSGSSTDSSGTSYASPAAAAGALLLQQYHASLKNGQYMLASTLKTLIMGTAEDLGQTGPDYKFGYGLMNVEAAAKAIKNNSTVTGTNCAHGTATGKTCSVSADNSKGALVYEWKANPTNNSSDEMSFTAVAKGGTPLIVNLGWTDDEGPEQMGPDIDPTASRMVYDFDISVRRGSNNTFVRSWVLPGMANRTADATKASVNFQSSPGPFRQLVVDSPVADESMTIYVKKKTGSPVDTRTLSLVVTGLKEAAPATPNGTCGTANAVATATAPSANLCSAGTASSVTGSNGTWGWSCAGETGGTNASCSAPYGSQTLSISAKPITMTIDGTSAITASSDRDLPVTLTNSTSSVCSLSGTTATGVGAGTCTVTASQAGTGDTGTSRYLAAQSQSVDITVTKKSQSISFGAKPVVVAGGTGTLSAQALPSMLAVSFAANGMQSACSVSGTTVTGLAAGSCSVIANQAGDNIYAPAEQQILEFAVGQGSQTITGFTATPSSLSFGGGTATLSATGGASGQPVTYATQSEVCTVSGTTVTPTGIGTCAVTANQQGNANFTAAAQATLDIVISKGSQTITFGTAPTGVTVNGTGTASATSSADRSVTITSDTPAVCTVSPVAKLRINAVPVKESSSVTVTGVALGTCTLRATRAADEFFNAATDATQSFGIADGSGVTASTQDQVPDADGSGTGDGNGDGTKDSEQFNVVSLPSQNPAQYLTVATPTGSTLTNVTSVAVPDDAPRDSSLPFAGVSFTVGSVTVGGTTRVEVFFPYNPAINGVLKRNRITGVLERVPNATIRQIGTVKTAVAFDLVDGGPYDTDGLANGSINDPVFPVVSPTPQGNGGALGAWLLMPLMLMALRRRRLH